MVQNRIASSLLLPTPRTQQVGPSACDLPHLCQMQKHLVAKSVASTGSMLGEHFVVKVKSRHSFVHTSGDYASTCSSCVMPVNMFVLSCCGCNFKAAHKRVQHGYAAPCTAGNWRQLLGICSQCLRFKLISATTTTIKLVASLGHNSSKQNLLPASL